MVILKIKRSVIINGILKKKGTIIECAEKKAQEIMKSYGENYVVIMGEKNNRELEEKESIKKPFSRMNKTELIKECNLREIQFSEDAKNWELVEILKEFDTRTDFQLDEPPTGDLPLDEPPTDDENLGE